MSRPTFRLRLTSRVRSWERREWGDVVGDATQIRKTTAEDYPALAALLTMVYPDDPAVDAAQVRFIWERGDPARPNVRLVAEQDGRIVGTGYLRGAPPLPDLLLNVEVHPTARHRGIGSRLLAAVDAATDHRLPTLVMVPETDPASVAFAERHGFTERDRQSESSLDMASFEPERFASAIAAAAEQGIELTTMADVDSPEVRQHLFKLANRVTQDMPSRDPMAAMTYDEFVASWLEAHHSRPDLLTLALDHGRPVAASVINVQSDGSGFNWMTGVDPAHRGRGLGLAVKVDSLRRAKEAGVTFVRTTNHERNAPMLAINRRLGYETLPAIVWLIRDP